MCEPILLVPVLIFAWQIVVDSWQTENFYFVIMFYPSSFSLYEWIDPLSIIDIECRLTGKYSYKSKQRNLWEFWSCFNAAAFVATPIIHLPLPFCLCWTRWTSTFTHAVHIEKSLCDITNKCFAGCMRTDFILHRGDNMTQVQITFVLTKKYCYAIQEKVIQRKESCRKKFWALSSHFEVDDVRAGCRKNINWKYFPFVTNFI